MYAYRVLQNGTWMDDMMEAAAAAEAESVVRVGYHRDSSGFLAAKLDGEGALLWQWEVHRHAESCQPFQDRAPVFGTL